MSDIRDTAYNGGRPPLWPTFDERVKALGDEPVFCQCATPVVTVVFYGSANECAVCHRAIHPAKDIQ